MEPLRHAGRPGRVPPALRDAARGLAVVAAEALAVAAIAAAAAAFAVVVLAVA